VSHSHTPSYQEAGAHIPSMPSSLSPGYLTVASQGAAVGEVQEEGVEYTVAAEHFDVPNTPAPACVVPNIPAARPPVPFDHNLWTHLDRLDFPGNIRRREGGRGQYNIR
jgi:hypothetical protein